MDKVTCAICGKEFGKINYLHLRTHGITTSEYIDKYPDSKLTSDDVLYRMNRNRAPRRGEQHYLYGKKHPKNVRDKISTANSGKNNGMYGKKHTDTSKQKMSEKHEDVSGTNNPNYGGKCVTDEWRKKQSIAHIGQKTKLKIKVLCGHCGKEIYKTENRISRSKESFCSMECKFNFFVGARHPGWSGGVSFEPYCHKFNEKFKESIRDLFDRTCFLCGKSEVDNDKKLCIHHVNYDKTCLCENIKCEFVPLCHSCHSKTNFNRDMWEQLILNKLEVLN